MPATQAPASPIGAAHGRPSRRSSNPEYMAQLERLAPFEEIARLVIARRMMAGWTQKELAERMGTSHSVISRIESGQHATSVRTLTRLAEAFATHLVVGFDDHPEEVAIQGVTRQLARVA